MSEKQKLRFHYIKSPTFNEHPVHGAFGGPTASGEICMSLFSERAAIPTSIEYELHGSEDKPKNAVLVEGERSGRDGPVRFVHGAFYLSEGTAIALRDWLNEQLAGIEERRR